jgi:putative redox protein
VKEGERMNGFVVVSEGRDRYRISVRGHEVVVDQPVADGGEDTGPTPTELFVAGLASCVAFYGGRYLARHGIDLDGFVVEGSFEFAPERPARVGKIAIEVFAPFALPKERWSAFRAVVEHCTVHNSIRVPPEVDLRVVAAERVA